MGTIVLNVKSVFILYFKLSTIQLIVGRLNSWTPIYLNGVLD